MEIIGSANQKKAGGVQRSVINFFTAMSEKLMENVKKTKKIGEDDPRRIVHSIKVGLALTLVSLFYYFRPLYDGFGQAGMWAILTVVVVFEFTIGGTLSKSINRGVATLLAGALGVGAEYLAGLCGDKGEPIVLGLLVFLLAATSTFTRFIPHVKKKYDYGVLIFILTFSLVAVSGYRVNLILQLAHQRLATILLGGATCIIISIFVCPVWAGQDLHNLVSGNIEKLATFLEGFGGDDDKDKSYLEGYKNVLNSKATEESLANFAWWEPAHGGFRYNHPWKHYLKIGGLSRECASHIETLAGYSVNSKHTQAKEASSSELHLKIQPSCKKLSTESGEALRELATALKNKTFPSAAAETHIKNSKSAAEELKRVLENSSLLPTKLDLQEIMPLLVTSSVLIDVVACVERIAVSVNELSEKAGFVREAVSADQKQLLRRGIVKPVDDEHGVVIEINDKLGDSVENMKTVNII
ncbi:hypothetical protein ABFS82_10G061200 [Erythranthe guttata]